MNTNKIIALLLLLSVSLLCNYTVTAQEQPIDVTVGTSRKFTIAVQPVYIGDMGIRLDFEKRIGTSRQWLQIGPVGYYYSDSEFGTTTMGSNGYTIDKVAGGGLNLNYKRFFTAKENFYAMGGVSYTYFNVNYKENDYVPFIEDGQTLYIYETVSKNQKFNKLGTNVCIGVQSSLQRTLFIDAYMGLGYNYSIYNGATLFDDTMYSYGYRGLLFTFGFRIGFGFGKSK